jgi:membrane protein DedA with SNARE-associated domain
MTLIGALIFLVVFAVGGYLAFWIITKFLPEPAKTPALAIVGVILLVVLLVYFLPGVSNYKIW